MTTKSILTDPKTYAERIIANYGDDAIVAALAFDHACDHDARFARTHSWNDAVRAALAAARAADLKAKGEQLAAEIELVCETIAVFARAAAKRARKAAKLKGGE